MLGGGVWLFREHVLWPAPTVAFAGAEPSSGWLPFGSRRTGALVLVEAEVAGERVGALLDSGAEYSVLDAAFADRLDLRSAFDPPMVAYGVGGAPQLARGARADVRVGDLRLQGLSTAVLSLGPITQATGRPTPLILGQDVLQALVADIDFPNRRVRLHDPAAFPPPPGAVAAPVRREGRALLAQVAVEGHAVEALVDTGSSSLLALTHETAQAAGLLDGRAVQSGQSVVLGGVVQGGAVQAARFSFAGRELVDVEVTLFPSHPVPGFPKGLLGVEAFRRDRVILDHKRGRLWLAESEAG